MSQEAHKFNENNVYRVRRNSRLNQGLFLSKLVLKKHGTVQIEGMGECISLAFKFAQILAKNSYATIQTIHEENVEREGRKEINPKISILLKKTADFDKLTEGLTLRDNWSENAYSLSNFYFQTARQSGSRLGNGEWAMVGSSGVGLK